MSSEAASDDSNSLKLLSPEFSNVSDIPLVSVDISVVVSLGSVVLGSSDIVSIVVDLSVPVSDGVAHPSMSLHDMSSVGSSEPVVVWSLEGASDILNSSELLDPESSHVSNVPGILVDVSVVSGLSLVVGGSADRSSPGVD